MNNIYLDYAASTPVREEVVKAMLPFFTQTYANPHAAHAAGKEALTALEEARKKVAALLQAKDNDTLIFTGGGTESCNLAIKGIARANKHKGKHIITSQAEHKAVLAACKYLETEEGFTVTYLPVDAQGMLNLEELERAITPETILISIMYANNEIGTVYPVEEIARIAHKHNVLFHTDACQAMYEQLDVQTLGVDLMTLNCSKMYGPKGVGMLFIKQGVGIHPLIHGGGQENGLRSGTENVPGIVGFAKAFELVQEEKEREKERLGKLREFFVTEVQQKISNVQVNGPKKEVLCNNVSLTFKGIDGTMLLKHLNSAGIYVSMASACHGNEITISHVLQAIGLSQEEALATLRFTVGKYTTQEDLIFVTEELTKIVNALRKL